MARPGWDESDGQSQILKSSERREFGSVFFGSGRHGTLARQTLSPPQKCRLNWIFALRQGMIGLGSISRSVARSTVPVVSALRCLLGGV
jgi:hypothetical protein